MSNKKTNTYSINIDMTWSEEYVVTAKTKGEAKRKAWARFKKNPPKKNFTIEVDQY